MTPGLCEDTFPSHTPAFLEARRAPAQPGAQPSQAGGLARRQQARPNPSSKRRFRAFNQVAWMRRTHRLQPWMEGAVGAAARRVSALMAGAVRRGAAGAAGGAPRWLGLHARRGDKIVGGVPSQLVDSGANPP